MIINNLLIDAGESGKLYMYRQSEYKSSIIAERVTFGVKIMDQKLTPPEAKKAEAIAMLQGSYHADVEWVYSSDFSENRLNRPYSRELLPNDAEEIVDILDHLGLDYHQTAFILNSLFHAIDRPKTVREVAFHDNEDGYGELKDRYKRFFEEITDLVTTKQYLDVCLRGQTKSDYPYIYLSTNASYSKEERQSFLGQRHGIQNNIAVRLVSLEEDPYSLKGLANFENNLYLIRNAGNELSDKDLFFEDTDFDLLAEKQAYEVQLDTMGIEEIRREELVRDFCYLRAKLELEKRYLVQRIVEEEELLKQGEVVN